MTVHPFIEAEEQVGHRLHSSLGYRSPALYEAALAA